MRLHLLGLLPFWLNSTFAQEAKPLPDVAELRARAVANYARASAAVENYLCRSRVTEEELDGKGRTKKTTTVERESFFVHGTEIQQVVGKDGKPLSPGEQRKQDEAVKKAIAAASDPKHKSNGNQLHLGDVLKLATLSHERRVLVSGRPTIVFDVMPNPGVKTQDLPQKFVAAMAGTVSIDEETGTLQDANLRGVNDVKVGGGLLANVHKGFAVHVVTVPQADGVWLVKVLEGQGDARVGLFLHEAGRFRQETEGCRLYNVDAEATPHAPKP